MLTLKVKKMDRVIADSTIWREYLEKGNTKEAKILEKLIKDDKIVICGYTIAEVLKDIKEKETFEKLLKGFLALPYVEIEKEDWIEASKLLFESHKKGEQIPLEVAILRVLSKRKRINLLTKDTNKSMEEKK